MVQQRKISRVLDFEIAIDPFSGWNISRESTLTISFCTIDQKVLGIQVLIQCNTSDALFDPLFRSNLIINIAKGTTDPRVEFISQVITQILIKQIQNFVSASTSKSQQNISISTKLKILAKSSFRILTNLGKLSKTF